MRTEVRTAANGISPLTMKGETMTPDEAALSILGQDSTNYVRVSVEMSLSDWAYIAKSIDVGADLARRMLVRRVLTAIKSDHGTPYIGHE